MVADFIPYGRQYIDDDDISEVVNVLKSDFLTCGPYVEKFEKSLCDVTGAEYSVVCSNGTAALHLAMYSLGVQDGDNVIVPTVTFLASANAAKYCGANIIFADVDPETGLLTADTLEDAYNRAGGKVKAVVVVHLCGQHVDMPAVHAFCKPREIYLIEDACHAIGGKDVGACKYSDMAVFSFHPVKTVAMGEGGAVTTNNEKHAVEMVCARSHGINRGSHWKYSMENVGYNYRACDIQCALGYSQLKKLDLFIRKRCEIAKTYDEFFQTIDWAQPVVKYSDDIGYHLYPILIDFYSIGKTREVFMGELRERGIGTQVHYIPVHTQPYYGGKIGDLPGAKSFYERTLSFPIYYSLTNDQQKHILKVLSDYR